MVCLLGLLFAETLFFFFFQKRIRQQFVLPICPHLPKNHLFICIHVLYFGARVVSQLRGTRSCKKQQRSFLLHACHAETFATPFPCPPGVFFLQKGTATSTRRQGGSSKQRLQGGCWKAQGESRGQPAEHSTGDGGRRGGGGKRREL